MFSCSFELVHKTWRLFLFCRRAAITLKDKFTSSHNQHVFKNIKVSKFRNICAVINKMILSGCSSPLRGPLIGHFFNYTQFYFLLVWIRITPRTLVILASALSLSYTISPSLDIFNADKTFPLLVFVFPQSARVLWILWEAVGTMTHGLIYFSEWRNEGRRVRSNFSNARKKSHQ